MTTSEVEKKTDLVTLTIDGVQVSVPAGTLIIRAAEQVGVQIPRFCDHPLLDPVGACRQCLVDVPDAGNGRPMPKPQASCTIPVAEGMVVNTQVTSEVADKAQQGIMEFLLVNHPLDCPVCDKGGECPLQNQAMSNGRGESRFAASGGVKRTFPKPINISAQVLLDRERCVLCARCTRFSEQIAGDPFIELLERGALQQVGIYEKEPFESYFSGNAIQICPVGALTSAEYRFRSRPFDLVSTPSVAEHDACGAAIRVDHRRGQVMRRLSGNDPEVNEEWITDKDRFAFGYLHADDRLSYPQIREDGALRPASWPEAFAVAARGLADAGATGVLPGGRVTAEDAFAYSTFARVALGTNDIDFRSRPHSAEEADFLAAEVVLRQGATYADLDAADSVVLVGLEPEDEAGTIFLRLRKANRHHRTRVWSVAPYATNGLRKMGGSVIAARPGGEADVVAGLAHRDDVELGSTSVILVGERMASVPGALTAVARLARTTGAKLAWVPRRAGDRGAVETGCLPNLLPGGRPVTDASARVDAATAWGVAGLPDQRGRDADAIIAAVASGALGGLVVGGVDPDDTADPAAFRAALDDGTLRRRPGAARDGRDARRRRRVPGRTRHRQAGHLRELGGTPARVRGGVRQPERPARRPRPGRHRRGAGHPAGIPYVGRRPRADGRDGSVGRRPGDASRHPRLDRPRPATGAGRLGHLEADARQRLDAGRREAPARHGPYAGLPGLAGRGGRARCPGHARG